MSNCLDCNEDNIGSEYTECLTCKGDSDKCTSETDSACVIYHPDNDKPSKLENLNLPNMVSAEKIFETIDDLLGTNFNIPITAIDSSTIDLTTSDAANHTIKADLKISSELGNNLEVRNDGLYGKKSDGKVKIDQNGVPKYLENQLIGGTDGCVSVSINKVSDTLLIHPDLNIVCLLQKILNDDTARNIFCQIVSTCGITTIQPIVNMTCGSISIPTNTFTLGTSTTYNLVIPVSVVYSGNISVIISSVGNFSINHNVVVNSSTTSITVPLVYNGLGSVGTQQFTVQLVGTQNPSSCVVSAVVNAQSVPCGVNPPSNIVVNTTANTANVTFTHASPIPVNGYRFRFRRTDIVTTFTTVMIGTGGGIGNTFSLNQLLPNTPYEYIMESICNDATSFSTPVNGTFLTQQIIVQPPSGDCYDYEIFNTGGLEPLMFTYTTCEGATFPNNFLNPGESTEVFCANSVQINSGNGFIQQLGVSAC